VQMWVVRNRGYVVCLDKSLHNEVVHNCTVHGIV
jgi:hypothetical protein